MPFLPRTFPVYRIVENFRERTFANWSKIRFSQRSFCGLLAFAAPKDTMPQNFAEKTFTNSHTTTKFAKVFSLESFPLYGGVVVCHQSDDTFSTDDTMM